MPMQQTWQTSNPVKGRGRRFTRWADHHVSQIFGTIVFAAVVVFFSGLIYWAWTMKYPPVYAGLEQPDARGVARNKIIQKYGFGQATQFRYVGTWPREVLGETIWVTRVRAPNGLKCFYVIDPDTAKEGPC